MFGFFSDRSWLEAGEKARMLHGRWLTRALQAPAGRLPRIPTRRMSEGGFGPMMRTVEGRDYAEFWWETALLRLDVLDTDEPAD